MQRTYTNAALGTGSLVGFLGSVVVRSFEALGFVQTASWMHGLTDQASGLHINWTAISFDLFVFCTFALIGLNLRKWKRDISAWIEDCRPIERSAFKAAMWICYWSHLGDSWPQNIKEKAALAAMSEAAKSGKLKMRGCPHGKFALEAISSHEFEGNLLGSYEANDAHDNALRLTSGDQGRELYTGLTVDEHQVKKLWPSNGRHGFLWDG